MNWLDLSRPFVTVTTDNSMQTHMDIGIVGSSPAIAEFIRPGVLLDLRAQAETGRIGLAEIGLSSITEGCAVVLRTGWEQYFGEAKYTACPDIEYELVDALIDRGAKLLMVDSPGVYGGARSDRHSQMDLHIVARGSIAVEHLCNVGRLPETFTLYCFPLSVTGANWLPARVLASW